MEFDTELVCRLERFLVPYWGCSKCFSSHSVATNVHRPREEAQAFGLGRAGYELSRSSQVPWKHRHTTHAEHFRSRLPNYDRCGVKEGAPVLIYTTAGSMTWDLDHLRDPYLWAERRDIGLRYSRSHWRMDGSFGSFINVYWDPSCILQGGSNYISYDSRSTKEDPYLISDHALCHKSTFRSNHRYYSIQVL